MAKKSLGTLKFQASEKRKKQKDVQKQITKAREEYIKTLPKKSLTERNRTFSKKSFRDSDIRTRRGMKRMGFSDDEIQATMGNSGKLRAKKGKGKAASLKGKLRGRTILGVEGARNINKLNRIAKAAEARLRQRGLTPEQEKRAKANLNLLFKEKTGQSPFEKPRGVKKGKILTFEGGKSGTAPFKRGGGNKKKRRKRKPKGGK
jgi:hypothetical protein